MTPGGPVAQEISYLVKAEQPLKVRYLPWKNRYILRQALLWQLDRFVPYEAAKDLLWGNDPDGGPLYADNIIHVLVMQLRREGCVIEIWYGVGLRMRSK